MQVINCDVCRKKVENPITNLTFFYFADHNICEACRDILELQIKPIIRSKAPFNYEWYGKMMDDSIQKAIQKGKF
jgi:hypothetical protein